MVERKGTVASVKLAPSAVIAALGAGAASAGAVGMLDCSGCVASWQAPSTSVAPIVRSTRRGRGDFTRGLLMSAVESSTTALVMAGTGHCAAGDDITLSVPS